MFLAGAKAKEIAKELGISVRTIHGWKSEDQWQVGKAEGSMQLAVEKRYYYLLEKKVKSELELNEMSMLMGHMERLLKMEERQIRLAMEQSQTQQDKQSSGKKQKRRKKSPGLNDFSEIDIEELLKKFKDGLFAYQLELWEHLREKVRNILKSRQIGLTYYFAREAFVNALCTGDNQVFLSASRNQVDEFRLYIKDFAMEWFGVDIVGRDKIVLQTPNGKATLYFKSTNARTAQSHHGHLYVDEYFWIPDFETLNAVASPMASQKKWRITYFSTPSAKSHQAYPFWSGDEFNERMKKDNKPLIKFPGKAELRKQGVSCKDGQWRRVITIKDAEAMGCDLFDLADLQLRYSEDRFRQLFMCDFIDDSASIFRLSQLEKCVVDTAKWRDVDYEKTPPYAGPVWIGYDPARHHDAAVISVLAAPMTVRGKFRVIEKIVLVNCPWTEQAKVIEELCKQYRVDHIGIDRTGIGDGVFEMVQRFYPTVEGIYYNPEAKNAMVLKAMQVIKDRRLEYDAIHSDITGGFMQIKRSVTPKSAKVTYYSDRTETAGHADAAWSIMNALKKEGLMRPDEGDQIVCSLDDDLAA